MLQLPKVIAHRGASAYAPENTLAAFREARRRGAPWVEIDVMLTADGVPIVMHDESLKRTTGLDRLVAETPRAELPAEVPTFAETIALLGELGLGCNVEIKPCQGREIETARAAVGMLDRLWPAHLPPPLLSSFNEAALQAAREAAPGYARAALLDALGEDWQARAEAVGAIVIDANARKLSAQAAAAVKRAGYGLVVWTVNDPVEARRLAGLGADSIITDLPDVILGALDR